MNILEAFFIIFTIAIPPSIVVLFIYDKREIARDFKQANASHNKYKD